MSCNLTLGRLVSCKDSIGGLKKVFFVSSFCSNIRSVCTLGTGATANVMSAAGFTLWDVAADDGGTNKTTVFQYDLRPNLSSVTINTTSDPSTGTTFFEQTLSLSLQKLTAAQCNEIKLMAYNRSQVFVQDMNDNVFLLGMNNGVDVSGGTIVTGAAKGDMTGFTIELRAEETDPMIWLPATAGPGDNAGTATAKYPFDGLSDETNLIITVGT
tara:strand:+ start:1345 stop:1983 length:639 start_codon:yes stop_codon:yes gene_type:complete